MQPRVIDHTPSQEAPCPPSPAISEIKQPQPGTLPERQKQILWRKFWAKVAERVGSTTRAMIAKSVFQAIQDEFGDLEAICWPSTVVESSGEYTREEVWRAIEDLVGVDLISLDANQHGVYVDFVLRGNEEAEYLSDWFVGELAASK